MCNKARDIHLLYYLCVRHFTYRIDGLEFPDCFCVVTAELGFRDDIVADFICHKAITRCVQLEQGTSDMIIKDTLPCKCIRESAKATELARSLGQKNTIDQVTTVLATSTNVLFPGNNHLLTTRTDDPTL